MNEFNMNTDEGAKRFVDHLRANGGPAHPYSVKSKSGPFGFPGMSLRDYFAGQVLCGLLADPNMTVNGVPELAYEIADAMLKARSGDPS